MALQPGTIVGEWVVEQAIGPDDLYQCHRVDTPFRKAVLRVVRASDAVRLHQEANELMHLEHPNIHGVLGLESSGDDLYLVSESVQGTTLAAFVRPTAQASGGALPLKAALEIAVQVADALSTAHRRGIQHGDVRPENVLLTSDGSALLSGFSLRSSHEEVARDTAYGAPEANEDPSASPQGDAYALGVLLYELIGGIRVSAPHHDGPLTLGAGVPAALVELVERLTDLDPESRCTVPEAQQTLRLALRESFGDTGSGAAESTFVDDDSSYDAQVPSPGTVGRYLIVRELGRGGSGVVYEADDPSLMRRVAVKVLLAGTFARAQDVERFLREARAVAQLDHPDIVTILEFDRDGSGAWFAMDFIKGPTLLEHIRTGGALPWRQAVEIAARLARALHHAHEHGLVHRDVKPNNVMLEDGVHPRLTDFGLAVDTRNNETNRLTRTGQVLGTPMYMSPEQAMGELDQIGPPTDVYGVGVVLYESLTGQVPFEGNNPLAIINNVLEGEVTPLRTLAPQVPRDVEVACLKAMRRQPQERYATALALAEDLERCLRGEPIRAAPPTLLDRVRWFVRRNGTILTVAMAAMAAAIVVAGLGTMLSRTLYARATNKRELIAAENLEGVLTRVEQFEAAGDFEEAERAWEGFANHPEHRGTEALVDGWLARAQHYDEVGDIEGRLGSLSSAYAASEHELDQERALVALAQGLSEERHLERLPAVVDSLLKHAPHLKDDAQVRLLRRDALAARRELAAASRLARGTTDGPLLKALSRAVRTGHTADNAVWWPGDDAVLMLRKGADHHVSLVGAAPKLPPVRLIRMSESSKSLLPLEADRPLALIQPEVGRLTLLEQVNRNRMLPLGEWSVGELRAATSADIDGDGLLEHYVAAGTGLYRLRGITAFELDEPHPATNRSASVINDVVSADLDGDGLDEVIVAAAEWGAYDVRVLGMDPASPDAGLALLARNKLGVVTDLAVLPGPDGRPTILAAKTDRYPNLRVFPEDNPTGEPRGLWRLRLVDGELEADRVLPDVCTQLMTGDLDGDGIIDAAAACDGDLVVLSQDHNGELNDVWVRRLGLLAIADVDPDPAMELVVHEPDADDAVWVLGAGRTSMPKLPISTLTLREPPEDVDAAYRGAWRRAEGLAYIGEVGRAAEALEQLAGLHWGRAPGRDAMVRAAELHVHRGAPGRAASLYQQVADDADGPQRELALYSAVDAWREHHDPKAELAVLRELEALGGLDRDDEARLALLSTLEDAAAVDLTFDRPLDPRWKVLNPLGLRRHHDQGLQVEAFGTKDLARLPLDWPADYLELEIEFEVLRAEWDGGFEIGLVPTGASEPFYGLRVDGRGGGEVVWPRMLCAIPERGFETEIEDAGSGRMVARLQLFAGRAGLECGWRDTSGEVLWREAQMAQIHRPPTRVWDLVLRATGQQDTLARVALHRISMLGPNIRGPEGGSSSARIALVDGDAAGAAELLKRSRRRDPLLQVAIALDQDDGAALQRALDGLAEPQWTQTLDHLVHCRIDAVRSELEPVAGDAWPLWFARAWDTHLHTHSTDPELVAAMLRHLEGLERVEAKDPGSIATLVLLNARRGSAAIVQGRLPLAQSSLQRSLELFERLDPDAYPQLRQTVAAVHLDQAVVAVLNGAPSSEARSHLERALQVSPAPAVLADMASVRPELQDLRQQPEWSALVQFPR